MAEFRERGGDAKFADISGVNHSLSSKFADQILPMIVEFVGP